MSKEQHDQTVGLGTGWSSLAALSSTLTGEGLLVNGTPYINASVTTMYVYAFVSFLVVVRERNKNHF